MTCGCSVWSVADRSSSKMSAPRCRIGRTTPRPGRRERFDSRLFWEEAEARIRGGGRYPPSWFVLLAIAGLIASVGIFTNSEILIVGAMVVGPEYSAIISVALGITKNDHKRIRAGAAALFFGFLIAIVVTLVFSVVVRASGLEPEAFRLGIRPVSNLINTPNVFSVVVATLAGIVGVVSLVEARTGALIGVFISVTTIPAAADIGVSSAFQDWSEAGGSLVQLLLNVAILMAVGAVGLVVQQRVWRRVGDGRSEPNPALNIRSGLPSQPQVRTLTARATTSPMTTSETVDCTAMANFPQGTSGITSVGLNAVLLVNARYK
jgi:uncharacterized hydrophobic protein (TIGR00271 family)